MLPCESGGQLKLFLQLLPYTELHLSRGRIGKRHCGNMLGTNSRGKCINDTPDELGSLARARRGVENATGRDGDRSRRCHVVLRMSSSRTTGVLRRARSSSYGPQTDW